jgi:serine/threonine-protein phosphatase 2B regulatory subunit
MLSHLHHTTKCCDVGCQTFDQADIKADGKIDQEEWNEFAKNNPYVLRNMSLPYLK